MRAAVSTVPCGLDAQKHRNGGEPSKRHRTARRRDADHELVGPLVKMKARTGEKSLWGSLLGSSGVGEFVDTLIFGA
jgi:hypothetical protein